MKINTELKREKVRVTVKRWLDKINGNTYHSVYFVAGDIELFSGLRYGYGEMYKQTTVELLQKAGVTEVNDIPVKYHYEFFKSNFDFAVYDNCKKRELKIRGHGRQ